MRVIPVETPDIRAFYYDGEDVMAALHFFRSAPFAEFTSADVIPLSREPYLFNLDLYYGQGEVANVLEMSPHEYIVINMTSKKVFSLNSDEFKERYK